MLETTIVLAAALKFGLFGATSAGHLVSSFSSAARHGTLSDPMLVIDLTTNPLVMTRNVSASESRPPPTEYKGFACRSN